MAGRTAAFKEIRSRIVGRTALGFLAVWLGCAGLGLAQDARPYDLPQADPGYDTYYHDGAQTADRARHWGYHDGWVDGRKDQQHGHSFRPTQGDHFEDAPDHGDHHGMSRDEYKNLYRDAYRHGYENGYRGEDDDGRDGSFRR